MTTDIVKQIRQASRRRFTAEAELSSSGSTQWAEIAPFWSQPAHYKNSLPITSHFLCH